MRRRGRILLGLGALAVTVLALGGVWVLFSVRGSHTLFPTFPPLAARFRAGAHACAHDRDCGATHYEDGKCCHTGCGLAEAYSRAFIDALEREIRDRCSGAVCPNFMCEVSHYDPTTRYDSRCVAGACQRVHFSWSDARLADVGVVDGHPRIGFESNRLRLTVRFDGISYEDPAAVAPFSDQPVRARVAALVSEWATGRGRDPDVLLPGVAERLARGRIDWRVSLATLAKELKDPALIVVPGRDGSCVCPSGDPLCSCR